MSFFFCFFSATEEESRQRAMEAEIRAIEVEMLDRRRQLAIW